MLLQARRGIGYSSHKIQLNQMEYWFEILSVIVFVAYLVGTIAGFGAGVLAVAFGVHFLPLTYIIPVIVPLNLVVSAWIAVQHRQYIDSRVLFQKIIPYSLLGLMCGMLVYYNVDADRMKKVYGGFVALLALAEFARLQAATEGDSRPRNTLWLLLGGFVQGLWVSGGPLLVYWANQAMRDKHVFRATLSAMWILLNTGLAATHAFGGTITAATLVDSTYLLPALALGLFGGEWLHKRLPERTFRILVNTLLLLAGVGILL